MIRIYGKYVFFLFGIHSESEKNYCIWKIYFLLFWDIKLQLFEIRSMIYGKYVFLLFRIHSESDKNYRIWKISFLLFWNINIKLQLSQSRSMMFQTVSLPNFFRSIEEVATGECCRYIIRGSSVVACRRKHISACHKVAS